jgi:hypothetical protein
MNGQGGPLFEIDDRTLTISGGRYQGHQERKQKSHDVCDHDSHCVTKGANISVLTAPDDATQEDDTWDSILDVYRVQRNARPLDPIISRLLVWVHISIINISSN